MIRLTFLNYLRVAALTVGLTVGVGTTVTFAADPWPGEIWQNSTHLTYLESEFRRNLSGAYWNPETRKLWVCVNNPAVFVALSENAQGDFVIDRQNGSKGVFWISGDLEAITQVDESLPYVYLLDESSDSIKQYDISNYQAGARSIRDWNLRRYLPTPGDGAEGLTFVPDIWLKRRGFVDANGNAYTSKKGMGGLMFVAHQNGGYIYAFDLDPNSADVGFVGRYNTGNYESSGLEFDRSSGFMFIWHNTYTPNYLEVTDLSSSINSSGDREFYRSADYNGPKNGNLEGIALSPASANQQWMFIVDDDNQDNAALMWFSNFRPNLVGPDFYTTGIDKTITVTAPGVIANDYNRSAAVTIASLPQHGVLSNLFIGSRFNGGFSYTPDAGYSGNDSFTYRNQYNQVAQVNLAIGPGGQPPQNQPFLGKPIAVPGVLEAEHYDIDRFFDTTAGNEGRQLRQDDVDIEKASVNHYNIGWTSPGEWLEYSIDVASTGTYEIKALVASQSSGGSFSVSLDGHGLSQFQVPVTGGWQNWQSVIRQAHLSAGKHVLKLTMGQGEFNVNAFTFTQVVTTPPTPTPGKITVSASSSQNPNLSENVGPAQWYATQYMALKSVLINRGNYEK